MVSLDFPDNPLLVMLGRRGRWAVVQVLLAGDLDATSIRDVAHRAGVPPAVAQRVVQELQDLGALEVVRPGRNAHMRWLEISPVRLFLQNLVGWLPDVRGESAQAFVAGYEQGDAVVQFRVWTHPTDAAGNPNHPTRIAVLWRRDEEAAWDGVDGALDAVRAAGWPAPEVSVLEAAQVPRDAAAGDAEAQAILQGRRLQ